MSDQYSEQVIQYIRDEGLAIGSRLPAEVEMAGLLGLSRNSVREAYVDLISRGLIRRKHGVGTFVSEPPILNSLGGNVGFWSLIERSGKTPSLTELARGLAVPPSDIAGLLEYPQGRAANRLRWLFHANGQPCILIDHYPASIIPLDDFELSAHNVLPPLQPYMKVEGARLSTQTTAVNADPTNSSLLHIASGQALLSGLAVVTDGDGKVVMASRSWMVPELFATKQEMDLSPLHFSGASAQSLEG